MFFVGSECDSSVNLVNFIFSEMLDKWSNKWRLSTLMWSLYDYSQWGITFYLLIRIKVLLIIISFLLIVFTLFTIFLLSFLLIFLILFVFILLLFIFSIFIWLLITDVVVWVLLVWTLLVHLLQFTLYLRIVTLRLWLYLNFWHQTFFYYIKLVKIENSFVIYINISVYKIYKLSHT